MNKIKDFFANFKYRFASWAQGRYLRNDELNWFLLITVMLMNIFVPTSTIRSIIGWVLIIIFYLRFFSKNYSLQYKLNQPFAKLTYILKKYAFNPFIKWVRTLMRNLKDIKKCRYRKCPHCKKTLRLPISRGLKSIDCPICHKEFKTIIL